ncbi:GNAT family N-acetyltransferase [Clostridium sp. DL-VIII]|uniref:GNAT family N-acetyltransferase n=1 Tax=Clostridium sp. DL-VIII TaxID=641107 RepID=UPI0002F36BDE|nr:GNAT family N-acetyltransferase [Clostridium sp. DL-VIII]
MYTYEWSDWRNGMFLWVQSVYVDEEYRRNCIFKELYAYVKNTCDKNKELAGIRLYVEKENHNAKATYEPLGMSECNYHMYEYEK